MVESNSFHAITVLIPGYSIEDLPSDQSEAGAGSLLNAFAAAWDPRLLTAARAIPDYRQAEATELPPGRQIVAVPQCSEEWLGHEWQDHFSNTESVVLHDCSSRDEYVSQIAEHFPAADLTQDAQECLQRLAPHFHALGTYTLQTMLLSRRLHFFVDPDFTVLQQEALAAADAVYSADDEAAKEGLRKAFECLLDCREQFFPAECFFVDMCLPSDQTTPDELAKLIAQPEALSLLSSGDELEAWAEQSPAFRETVERAAKDQRLSLLTGHRWELRTSLNSLAALYSDLDTMPDWVKDLTETSPLQWARRRFGLTAALPSVLEHFGFAAALHIVLDDGLYPDSERGQMNWEAPDGTNISAVSRIPLAIDGAASFQRFADRYTESMQEDSNAVMMLARLPEVKTPWLRDLQIGASYSPVLGEFVTFAEFVERTSGASQASRPREGEYLSPFLIQSSVLKTESPLSSPAALLAARNNLESVARLEAMHAVLQPQAPCESTVPQLETRLNAEDARRGALLPSADSHESLEYIADAIQLAYASAVEAVAGCIPATSDDVVGVRVINPLPFARNILIDWPQDAGSPAADQSILSCHIQDGQARVLTAVPPGGFAWLTTAGGSKKPAKVDKPGSKPLAEELLLRNKHFEVLISEASGGIQSVRFHNSRAIRVSQHVALRYESPKQVEFEGEKIPAAYAVTKMVSAEVLSTGPAFAAIRTHNEIIDVEDFKVITKFRQTVSLERESTRLVIDIEFDEATIPPGGNPWMSYIGSRFAWDNESASITRSMLGQATSFRGERFEAADYIEVADSDQRLLIVPHGRPYHRRTGGRMLDSLLLPEGETSRSFRFTLDFDASFPLQTVQDVTQPMTAVSTGEQRPGTTTGWILGLSAKNVQLARARVIPAEDGTKLRLLLQETEGRSATCQIRLARPAKSARLVRANGKLLKELELNNGVPTVQLRSKQLREVEIDL